MWILFLFCFIGLASADDRDQFLPWVAKHTASETHAEAAGDYRMAAELFQDVADAIEVRPGLTTVENIGHTHDGRPLWAFHIADPSVPVRRKVLVFGGIHAMEWIAADTAVAVLEQFVASPLPGVQLTVVPLLNPDGRAKVERDLGLDEDRWRRGNRYNVDLNRDFAVNREPEAVWARLPVTKGFYEPTPGPLSQPESKALDALADRERFHRAVSLHAFGGFIYYPWSGRFKRPPDAAELQALGRTMQHAQSSRSYRVRQLGRNLFFFRAQGSEIDHLYGTYDTRAFLVELTRSGAFPLRHFWHFWPLFRRYNPEERDVHMQHGTEAVFGLIRAPTTDAGF